MSEHQPAEQTPIRKPEMIVDTDLATPEERALLTMLAEGIAYSPARFKEQIVDLPQRPEQDYDEDPAGFTLLRFAATIRAARLYEFDDDSEVAIRASPDFKELQAQRSGTHSEERAKALAREMRIARLRGFIGRTSLYQNRIAQDTQEQGGIDGAVAAS